MIWLGFCRTKLETKTFIGVSREYYAHLLSFKVRLEHVLVECFSSATSAQVEETNEAHQSCTQARTMLPGWQQWLEEVNVYIFYYNIKSLVFHKEKSINKHIAW